MSGCKVADGRGTMLVMFYVLLYSFCFCFCMQLSFFFFFRYISSRVILCLFSLLEIHYFNVYIQFRVIIKIGLFMEYDIFSLQYFGLRLYWKHNVQHEKWSCCEHLMWIVLLS